MAYLIIIIYSMLSSQQSGADELRRLSLKDKVFNIFPLQPLSFLPQTPSLTYNAEKIVGSGTFGVVYQASCVETGERVAIKKVFQDKKYKNRELQIIRELLHPNIVRLRTSFLTSGDNV